MTLMPIPELIILKYLFLLAFHFLNSYPLSNTQSYSYTVPSYLLHKSYYLYHYYSTYCTSTTKNSFVPEVITYTIDLYRIILIYKPQASFLPFTTHLLVFLHLLNTSLVIAFSLHTIAMLQSFKTTLFSTPSNIAAILFKPLTFTPASTIFITINYFFCW